MLKFIFVGVILLASSANGRQLTRLFERAESAEQLISELTELRNEASRLVYQAKDRAPAMAMMCQGRLTLSASTPIVTSDPADTNTLRFTPYQGNRIALYNGTKWEFLAFSEQTISFAGTLTAGFNYDVWAYNNAGTVTLETTAWNSDTARVGANDLATLDGVYVRNGATTRRYLGTFRSVSTSNLRDSSSSRFLYNYYHRQPRILQLTESTDSWTYNAVAVRQVRASATNQFDWTIGVDEVPVLSNSFLAILGRTANFFNNSTSCTGVDAVACITDSLRGSSIGATLSNPMWSESNHYHTEGYHYMVWSESSANDTGTNDPFLFGDDAGDGRIQTGVYGIIEG